jgi:hypothetical protein
MLKASASPRDQALSGAGAAAPGCDMSENAAVDSSQRSLLSVGWIETYSRFEGSEQEAQWRFPVHGMVGLGRIRYQGFSDIPGRDEDDNSTGTYSASTWALEAGVSGALPVQGLRGALLLGGGMDAVSSATAWGGWVSGGLAWASSRLPFSAGLSVQNLGHGTKSGDYDERLPAIAQLGVSWTFQCGNWQIVPMADARLVADEDMTWPLALEARWNGFSLRTGFPVARAEARPSFGVGYLGQSWGIDAGLGWHSALGFAPSGQLSLLF